METALVELELRGHHVEVAALKHGPVDEPLILRGGAASAPATEIGRGPDSHTFFVFIWGTAPGKERAVELGRIVPVGIAAERIPKNLIILPHHPARVGRVGLAWIDEDVAAIPEIAPPGEVFFPCDLVGNLSVRDVATGRPSSSPPSPPAQCKNKGGLIASFSEPGFSGPRR